MAVEVVLQDPRLLLGELIPGCGMGPGAGCSRRCLQEAGRGLASQIGAFRKRVSEGLGAGGEPQVLTRLVAG